MISINGKPIKITTFPDGSSSVNFPREGKIDSVNVSWEGQGVDKTVIELLLFLSSLSKRWYNFSDCSCLNLNYLPGGRADREFEEGDCIPAINYLELILDKAWMFSSVHIQEPHSDAYTEGTRDTSTVTERFREPRYISSRFNCNHVLFPDEGAYNRYVHLYNHPRYKLSYLRKQRSGGKVSIIGHNINRESHNTDTFTIVDDICDGGRTFIETSKYLKGILGDVKVNLAVCHGIFSKGLDVFKGHISAIDCINIVGPYVNKYDILKFNETNEGV